MKQLSFLHRLHQKISKKAYVCIFSIIMFIHVFPITDMNFELPKLKTEKIENMTFVTLPNISTENKLNEVSTINKQTKKIKETATLPKPVKQEIQSEETPNTTTEPIIPPTDIATKPNELKSTTKITDTIDETKTATPRALNAVLPPAQTWEYEFISGDYAKKAFYHLEYPTPTTYKTSFTMLGPAGIQGGKLYSQGNIGVAGFVPERFEYKVIGKSLVALTFIEDEKKIRFSSSEKVLDKPDDVQDFATLPLQVALMAQAYKNQFGVGYQFSIPVAHYKGYIENMSFKVKNIAHFGEISALHLVRIGGSRREFWLSMVKNSKTGIPTYTLIALLFDMGSKGIYYAALKGQAEFAPKLDDLNLDFNKETEKETPKKTDSLNEQKTEKIDVKVELLDKNNEKTNDLPVFQDL